MALIRRQMQTHSVPSPDWPGAVMTGAQHRANTQPSFAEASGLGERRIQMGIMLGTCPRCADTDIQQGRKLHSNSYNFKKKKLRCMRMHITTDTTYIPILL